MEFLGVESIDFIELSVQWTRVEFIYDTMPNLKTRQ